MVWVSLLASSAHARGYRIDMVPGGYQFECYMCHFRQPFQRLTVFGRSVGEHLLFRDDYPDELPMNFFVGDEGNPDWATLAQLDADGDGYTNGEELGDPEGLFQQFDPAPVFPITRPDLAEDFPCGSGTVEGPEMCDGDAFDGQTCADLGFVGGVLSCADDCTLDTGACHRCGDAIVQVEETCDANELDGQTCAGLGFVGGTLRCSDACLLDTTDCHRCGDGVVQPSEACDGEPPGDVSCADRGLVGDVGCTDCALDYRGCTMPDAAVLADHGLRDAEGQGVSDAAPVDAGLERDGPTVGGDAIVDSDHPDVLSDITPIAPRKADVEEGGCDALNTGRPWVPLMLVSFWLLGRSRRRAASSSRV